MSAPVILFVEDNEHYERSVRRSFARRRIPLDIANTWDEALALFRVVGHRLVIADYNLPGDDHGLQLLVEMKLLVPSARLVLISGALSVDAQELAARIPLIDGFYVKDGNLPGTLKLLADEALERADEETDWTSVGQKYLTPRDEVNEQINEIDDELRADISRRSDD